MLYVTSIVESLTFNLHFRTMSLWTKLYAYGKFFYFKLNDKKNVLDVSSTSQNNQNQFMRVLSLYQNNYNFKFLNVNVRSKNKKAIFQGEFSRISHSDANFCFWTQQKQQQQRIQIEIEKHNKHKWIIKGSQRGLRGIALATFAIQKLLQASKTVIILKRKFKKFEKQIAGVKM